MNFLARSDGAGGDGVMKTDDPRPAQLIFLLEEGELQPGGGKGVRGLAKCPGESGGKPSALALWLARSTPSSLLLCHPPAPALLSP